MMGGATIYPAAPASGPHARRALLFWLLDLIQRAPDPFLTLGHPEAVGSGSSIEAIEIELLGQRFRISVDEIDD